MLLVTLLILGVQVVGWVDGKFERVQTRIQEIEERFQTVDAKLDELNLNLGGKLERVQSSLDYRLDALEQKQARLEERINSGSRPVKWCKSASP